MGFLDYLSLGLGFCEREPQRKIRQPTLKTRKRTTRGQIAICEPVDFYDIVRFVGKLRRNMPIIVNFSRLKENVERGLDFVCGAVCALNGNLERISEGVYFYAPPNLVVENLKDKR